MIQKQKNLFRLFLAIFFSPELLWSPVANFYFELYQGSRSGSVVPLRDNFLLQTDNEKILKAVLLIQLVAIIFSLAIIIRNRRGSDNQLFRYLLIAVLFLLTFLTAFVTYFAFSFNMDIL